MALGGGDVPTDDGWFRMVLDAMLDHVAIGTAIRGEDGRIADFRMVFVNQSLVDGAGRRAPELIGGLACELYPDWRASGLFDRFAHVVETGEPWIFDRVRYEGKTGDGTDIVGWWSVSVGKLGDGYIAASRDVTELVEHEQAARRAAEERERNRLAVALLQQAALPQVLPEVEGVAIGARYEPASDEQVIGGDWYDVIELGGDRLGLVIADVAGHGPEAAGYMVEVRHVVRTLALEHTAPTEVLTRANSLLARTATDGTFATCCYGVVDLLDRTWTWASAGHLDPVVVVEGRRVPAAARPGPPLGVDDRARFVSSSVSLGSRARLALFTDGLVETPGEDVQDGVDRLGEWVEGTLDLGAADAVHEWCRRRGRGRDDVAAVCVDVAPDGGR